MFICWRPPPYGNIWSPPKKEKRVKKEGTRIGKEREGKKYTPRTTGDTRVDSEKG
jgi:hypothetical protein